MSERKLLLLNGPNLDRLGRREPHIYGTATLSDVEQLVREAAAEHGLSVTCVQSSGEGVLVDAVHAAADAACLGVVVNAGAYTHTSVALRDALVGSKMPFVEVHISNVHAREPFRHRSLLADVAVGGVFGLGVEGYALAVQGLVAHLRSAGVLRSVG